MFHAQLPIAERLLQYRQIRGQRAVGVALFHGDSGADAVSRNSRVQFDRAEIVSLQRNVDFAAAAVLREVCAP